MSLYNSINNNIIFLFLIIFTFFLKPSVEAITKINATKGLSDITFNSETNITTYKIRVDKDYSSDSLTSLILDLSYPYKLNRSDCTSECNINTQNISDIFYECTINKSECFFLNKDSKIIIESIISPLNCEFTNLNSLTTEIVFEASNIEFTCANYKLSFFFVADGLIKHPYKDFEFTFPIYYKDKKEDAECIFPKNNMKIACVIDAGLRLFEKGYFINFEYDKNIKLDNDLNLTLKLDKYVLEDDCGKNISSGFFIINKYYNILLLYFILLYIL
jgi:hypothetical protein